jgi:hypothetical protein
MIWKWYGILEAKLPYTTRLHVFPNDRKPTGKSKKPSGIVASRQQTADRKSTLFLTYGRQETIPDGSS